MTGGARSHSWSSFVSECGPGRVLQTNPVPSRSQRLWTDGKHAHDGTCNQKACEQSERVPGGSKAHKSSHCSQCCCQGCLTVLCPHHAVQVAEQLPNAPAVLVTAGEEGAAFCCRSTKGEHSGMTQQTPDTCSRQACAHTIIPGLSCRGLLCRQSKVGSHSWAGLHHLACRLALLVVKLSVTVTPTCDTL